MSIIQTVQKWGNGTGVRLPKQLLDAAQVTVGQKMEVSVKGNSLVLTPIHDVLHTILDGVSPGMIAGEYEWGFDVGAEQYE